MTALARCPCGKVPKHLYCTEVGPSWFFVFGSCCLKWRLPYTIFDGESPEKKGDEVWNAAPRGEKK